MLLHSKPPTQSETPAVPTVSIPPPYRGPTRGEAEVKVEGATVLGCIEAVEARYPGFRSQVLDDSGRLHRFVRLFLNGKPLDVDPLDTPVADDDEVALLAAIAGGGSPQ